MLYPDFEKSINLINYTNIGNTFTTNKVKINQDGYIYSAMQASSTGLYVHLTRNSKDYIICCCKNISQYTVVADISCNITPVKQGDYVYGSGMGSTAIASSSWPNTIIIDFIPLKR